MSTTGSAADGNLADAAAQAVQADPAGGMRDSERDRGLSRRQPIPGNEPQELAVGRPQAPDGLGENVELPRGGPLDVAHGAAFVQRLDESCAPAPATPLVGHR